VELSCKKDIPCLSAFDSEHFIAFLLRNDKVFCDISHCQECELNKDDKTLESIKSKIKEANRFLNEIGIEKEIEYRDYEDSRRGFFKAVFSSTKEIFDAKKIEKNRISRVPVKLEILKESLKPYASDIKNKEIKTSYSFLAQKRVEDSCDNCGDCMQFCPTEALFSAKEGRAIWFIAGKCIKCEICNDICKQKSIINEDSIDIVKWCFNRGEELIEHTIEICTECNTPFSYKGGEMICNRCKEFIEDFSDIFKLASEE
jgi:Pyruvate/2-oxoacid:ferredoxin oxidoreductase delta subunit